MSTMVKMRVPDDVLGRIDAEAERRGVTRTTLLLESWREREPSTAHLHTAAMARPLDITAAGTARTIGCPVHPDAGGVIGPGGRFFCDECRKPR
jgi:hypothetical protein